jgi:hypothetical protein
MQKWLILTLLLMCLLMPCAWSQATSGKVSGTVRDQSGAVIPNAEVTLTNTLTSVSVTNKSSNEGVYMFPTVAVGAYRLEVVSPGMEKAASAFEIQVMQTVVIDPVLKPGQVTTTVEVAAVSPIVVVDNSPIEMRLDRERIKRR